MASNIDANIGHRGYPCIARGVVSHNYYLLLDNTENVLRLSGKYPSGSCKILPQDVYGHLSIKQFLELDPSKVALMNLLKYLPLEIL